ncbi:NAD(P)H-dependent flavin oxidoreductase [Undibacterium sp. RuRC25W]|uniref:NAD(P)H-dependent flavin oxidoreductase n=1 Tax=Undibacterium sp. RuRC25W TaxID=3413047 RepID=UPI003BEFDF2E
MLTMRELFPHPIIQGPMAGGASTPALVAAVSNAGGLGSLACGMLSPDAMLEQAWEIRQACSKPFAMNLFVQKTPVPSPQEIEAASELLKPIWSQLGWEALPVPAKWCEDFDAQFEALLTVSPAVASFTFGIITREELKQLHVAGIFVIGTATHLAEAIAWQDLGADAVCLSGVEAGGHRGTFIGSQDAVSFSTMELLAQVVSQLTIPVIAAGNIVTGDDVVAALSAGAQAVQMGTAFLVTHESGIPPAYKQQLLATTADTTRQTRAITGRFARGLDNRFMQVMAHVADQVPAYPIQNALTAAIRAAAGKNNDTQWMSMWCGQGVARARAIGATELMYELVKHLSKRINTH